MVVGSYPIRPVVDIADGHRRTVRLADLPTLTRRGSGGDGVGIVTLCRTKRPANGPVRVRRYDPGTGWSLEQAQPERASTCSREQP